MKNEHYSVWAKRRDIPLAILSWLILIIVIFWLLSFIGRSLLLLVLASLLAYALVPAVKFFERFLPRIFAILVVYIVVLCGLGVVFSFVVSTAVHQLSMLVFNIKFLMTQNAHERSSPLVSTFEGFGISPEQLKTVGEQLTLYAENLIHSVIPFLTSIFSTILDMLVIAILSIYLLIDGENIVAWLNKNIPTSQQGKLQFSLHTTQKVVGGYIRGQILLSAIVGLLVGIGMAFFHVPYAVLLGLLAFIFAFVPLLGTFISGAACVLLALTNGWLVALFVLIYFIVIHIIEGDILGPRIVGEALGIHPIISILALIAGSELFGIIGAIFAAPVAGIGQAILVSIWSEWKITHSKSFSEDKKHIQIKIRK